MLTFLIRRLALAIPTLFGVLARWWPEYDSMRKDARFSAAVDRLRLPGYRSA